MQDWSGSEAVTQTAVHSRIEPSHNPFAEGGSICSIVANGSHASRIRATVAPSMVGCRSLSVRPDLRGARTAVLRQQVHALHHHHAQHGAEPRSAGRSVISLALTAAVGLPCFVLCMGASLLRTAWCESVHRNADDCYPCRWRRRGNSVHSGCSSVVATY